ncbi:hypothetical protein VNO77_22566 [Canavalia gladiata]|uniref:Uncharacterized protein n=1 Tax=Canavalia gladiata TaxID=3824 RepID=A0AAN9QB45_CANGL
MNKEEAENRKRILKRTKKDLQKGRDFARKKGGSRAERRRIFFDWRAHLCYVGLLSRKGAEAKNSEDQRFKDSQGGDREPQERRRKDTNRIRLTKKPTSRLEINRLMGSIPCDKLVSKEPLIWYNPHSLLYRMCDQVQNSPTLLHPMHTHFQPKRTPPLLEIEAHTSIKRSLTTGEQMGKTVLRS